jgi:hypothetical protein
MSWGGKGGGKHDSGKVKAAGRKDVSKGTAKWAKGKHAADKKGGKGGGSGNAETAGGKWG